MSFAREYVKFLVKQIAVQYGAVQDAIKGRDPREPGLREKTASEEKLNRIIKRRFSRQLARLRSMLELYMPDRKVVTATPPLDEMFDDEDEELQDIIKILVVDALNGVALFSNGVSFEIDWTLINKKAAEKARKLALDLVKEIDDNSRKVIRDAVASFIETPGFTIGDIIDQIRAIGFSDQRSQTIAVTETTRAYAEAERLAGLELKKEVPDVRVVKMWLTNNDDRVCDICGPLDGVEIEVEESFGQDVFGEEMMAPPAHPNCRCWISSGTRILES